MFGFCLMRMHFCLAKFRIAARRFCISHAVGAIASLLWLSADSPLQRPPTRRSSSDGLLGSHFAQMTFRRFDHVDPPATFRKDCATQALETIINPHFAAPQHPSHRFFFGRTKLGESDKPRIMRRPREPVDIGLRCPGISNRFVVWGGANTRL